MGTKARKKRERREAGMFAATLTRCEGTWLEKVADAAEEQRIEAATKVLRQQRKIAVEFYQNPEQVNLLSIELFRRPEFAPLHLEDWLIERIIDKLGEPPVVDEGEDTGVFTDYLRDAVLSFAHADIRRAMASQLRRFLPQFVAAEQWREAVAIDYNAFRTSLGNEVSPFLAQMTLEGLAHWYDEAEETPGAEPAAGQ